MDTDQRLSELKTWLSSLGNEWGIKPETLLPASSDASFRRYFRVLSQDGAPQTSYIIMDAPPKQEDTRPFTRISDLLIKAGLNVPEVLRANPESGFLLLSDLGNTTYLSVLNQNTAQKLYDDAANALITMQLASQPGTLPDYDYALLKRETDLFSEWFLGKHHQLTLTSQEQADLERVIEEILRNNLAQPKVTVHRDYHSRNLMLTTKNNPGILDFQDAVFGPITYDLASIFRDAYIEWEEPEQMDWVIRYWEKARKSGLPVQNDFGDFYRDFEWMGLQRHLKVLGIFARLYHRDGKEGYLKDIPLVFKYTRKVAERYNAFKPLIKLLDKVEGVSRTDGLTF
jgi:aminoglycoside/choline kinase family phosphotransferase